ncbi:MAG: bifunctional phosphopantothenoylcysteine decarboxylase/phosphopantothenate--cysteine ligase CoaBC [Actinomycetota bacterium]|nr:bifunctional phosphopantothenoylcysteine decarboxylase/phosphopantothenate--cysteine ligase CoaBC [Actinomycetota bacterium]
MTAGPADRPQPDDRLSSLRGARIVLGVSGGIAAYKAIELCRQLVDAGAHVSPVLTKGALRFVGAATFSALASEPAETSLFGGAHPIPHTRLGQGADLVVVAPATARVLGSYAAGISSDLLGATLLATRAPVLVCPAMHTEMWQHPAVQENVATLRRRGVHILEPLAGRLAGGDAGVGRLQEPEAVVAEAARLLAARATAVSRDDYAGRRVLVAAGGTREPIDPVRFIANRSSGKQGYAIARAAAKRGATVTLVTTVALDPPPGAEVLEVETAAEMAEAVLSRAPSQDVVVMAAAVADFRPAAAAPFKLRKSDGPPELVLEPTPDILAELGRARRAQVGKGGFAPVLVGFAAETEDLVERAGEKLRSKGVDLVVGNDVAAEGAGFAHDTNAVTIVSASGRVDVPLASKREVAEAVLDAAARFFDPSTPSIAPEKESQ